MSDYEDYEDFEDGDMDDWYDDDDENQGMGHGGQDDHEQHQVASEDSEDQFNLDSDPNDVPPEAPPDQDTGAWTDEEQDSRTMDERARAVQDDWGHEPISNIPNLAHITRRQLTELMVSTARPGEDGTYHIADTLFEALMRSGSIPGLDTARMVDEDEDDDDDEYDEPDGDWDETEDDDDEDEDESYQLFGTRRGAPGSRYAKNGRLRGWSWFELERKGKEAGKRLKRGGEFGRVGFPSAQETRMHDDKGQDDSSDASSVHQQSSISPRLSTSPKSSFRSPKSSSKPTLVPKRRNTGSSIVSEPEPKVRGIKSEIVGRGPWHKGMKGFGPEIGRSVWGRGGREEWSSMCLPNTYGTVVASYDSPPYIGQHSHDYSFFYTATQAFQMHLYSTQDALRSRFRQGKRTARSNRLDRQQQQEQPDRPARSTRRSIYARDPVDGDDHSLQKLVTVQGTEGSWTVTDADLSRDNSWMAYSSITSHVHMFNTDNPDEDSHTLLDFSEGGTSRRGRRWFGHDFGIWSIRWSADQKEIVAGAGSGQIMVYDVENKKRVLNVFGHENDVNGVCFADESSTNVIVSASDDGFLKVWDRRSISSSRPSGVLAGHTEGITFVDPKGDGRYVISNGKDQAIRLWDLRSMRTWNEISGGAGSSYSSDASVQFGLRGWDYRSDWYRKPNYKAHPLDCSVMTYRGHHVLRTLIRCHFSPESTGQQYIYTGGSNGVIWIYHLDGRVVQVLDRTQASPLVNPHTGEYNDPSAPTEVVTEYDPDPPGSPHCTVRDVSWNGNEPSLISTAWNRGSGDIAVHQWKGLGKGGLNRLEDWVEVNAANGGTGWSDDGAA